MGTIIGAMLIKGFDGFYMLFWLVLVFFYYIFYESKVARISFSFIKERFNHFDNNIFS